VVYFFGHGRYCEAICIICMATSIWTTNGSLHWRNVGPCVPYDATKDRGLACATG